MSAQPSHRGLLRHAGFAMAIAMAGLPGCRKTPPRIQLADVEKCELAIDRAMKQPTLAEGTRIYYEDCAGVYAEPACRSAFQQASKVPPGEQLSVVANPCRTAYCPVLLDRGELEACSATFQPTAENLQRTWPKLHEAILKNDARGLAPRLTRAMLGFYTRAMNWPGAPGAAATVPAPPENDASPSAAGSGAPPAAPSAAPAATAPATAAPSGSP